MASLAQLTVVMLAVVVGLSAAGSWVSSPLPGTQYYFSSIVASGTNAEQLCQSYAKAGVSTAHLASIHSLAESQFVFQTWLNLKPAPYVNKKTLDWRNARKHLRHYELVVD